MSQKSENDNFITGAPAPKISIFENGAKTEEFDDETRVYLTVEEDCAIRGNALEAARVAANSHLRKEVGPEHYHLKVKVYPHHVLRYHPLAGVAQADRYYEGMRKPFGRPTGRAALVDEDQEVLFVRIGDADLLLALVKGEGAEVLGLDGSDRKLHLLGLGLRIDQSDRGTEKLLGVVIRIGRVNSVANFQLMDPIHPESP